MSLNLFFLVCNNHKMKFAISALKIRINLELTLQLHMANFFDDFILYERLKNDIEW